MSRFKPKAEKLLPKEQIKEEEPKPTPEPAKTEAPVEASQLYYTVKTHCVALTEKGVEPPKVSPRMSEEELQKLYDEMHKPDGKWTKHFR